MVDTRNFRVLWSGHGGLALHTGGKGGPMVRTEGSNGEGKERDVGEKRAENETGLRPLAASLAWSNVTDETVLTDVGSSEQRSDHQTHLQTRGENIKPYGWNGLTPEHKEKTKLLVHWKSFPFLLCRATAGVVTLFVASCLQLSAAQSLLEGRRLAIRRTLFLFRKKRQSFWKFPWPEGLPPPPPPLHHLHHLLPAPPHRFLPHPKTQETKFSE